MVWRSHYLRTLRTEIFERHFWRDISAEFIATFFLVGVQCFVTVDWTSSLSTTTTTTTPRYAVDVISGALFKATVANWLAVTSLVWAFWKFGGCLMNPAVTVGFALACRITLHKAVWYIAVQVCGALAAVACLRALVPEARLGQLGLPIPNSELAEWQCYVIEGLITCQLVLVYLSSSCVTQTDGRVLACFTVGMSAALGVLFAFSSTGGSMNPARYVALTLLIKESVNYRIYVVGPLLGAVVAVLIYYLMWGWTGRPPLSSSDTLDIQPKSLLRGLRHRKLLIQYFGTLSGGLESGKSVASGGPPICYPCDECTARWQPNYNYERFGVAYLI